jgi:hypothetical protein
MIPFEKERESAMNKYCNKQQPRKAGWNPKLYGSKHGRIYGKVNNITNIKEERKNNEIETKFPCMFECCTDIDFWTYQTGPGTEMIYLFGLCVASHYQQWWLNYFVRA